MQTVFSRLPHPNSFKFLHIASLILPAPLFALLALLCLSSPTHGQSQIMLPLIAANTTKPSAEQPVDVQDASLALANSGKVFLPMASVGKLPLTTEKYLVGYSLESSISALGGRLTIHVPQQTIPMNGCTLTVVSPNPQADWLEAYIYVICDYSPPNPPKWITDLYKPITISMDYSKVDLTYLDETRLTMASGPTYDWAPEIGGWKPMPAMADTQTDTIWQTSVDVATKRVNLSTNHTFIVPRVAVGYSISDMTIGPAGTLYAAAAPVIYSVGNNGTLERVVNLDEVAGAADLHTSFSRFAVNTKNGEFYVALRGKAKLAQRSKSMQSRTPSYAQYIPYRRRKNYG